MTVIVVGIDPGTAITGFGVLSYVNGAVSVLTYGSITTSKESTDAERLLELYTDIQSLFEEYSPAIVSCEKLFVQNNISSVMSVSQARGVVLLAAQKRSAEIVEYTPPQIKLALTGHGRADKLQVQKMVTTLLGLPEIPQPDDVADALAIAYCYTQSAGFSEATRT